MKPIYAMLFLAVLAGVANADERDSGTSRIYDPFAQEEWERTKRLYDPANMKPQHLCDEWTGVDDDLLELCNAKADRLARKFYAGETDFDTYQVGVKEIQVEMVEAQRRRRLERYETLHGPRGDRAETRCEPDGRGIRCVTR